VSPAAQLATLLRDLPASYWLDGKIAAVARAYRLGLAQPYCRLKAEAARLAFAANYEPSLSTGKGAKAQRREQALLQRNREIRGWRTFAESTRRMQIERNQFLAAEAHEQWSEGRTSRHEARFAARNIHA
jgi:hypothetical protein